MPAGLSVLLLAAASAALPADASVLSRAIEDGNVDALAAMAAADPRSDRGRAAQAVLAAVRNKGRNVDSRLAKALALPLSPDERSMIHKEAANFELRRAHYRAALTHLDQALALATSSGDDAMRQTIDFLRPVAGIPPGRVAGRPGGSVPVTRDLAGLPRIPVQFGRATQDMVVDTGANFSTVTRSTAARLHLRMLDQRVSVRSVAKEDVQTQIGIADELQIGRTRISNVVFIVVPDEALSFAGGAYRIEAILGFPVMLALQRFAFVSRRPDSEDFLFGSALRPGGGAANLLFSGNEPVLLTRHADGHPLRMFIDSGAKTTTLYRRALERHPDLLQGAQSGVVRLGGVGGTREETSFTLPKMSIAVAALPIALKDIAVITMPATDRDGAIGQDVLRHGRVAAFDFQTMTLCVGTASADCPATRALRGE